MIHPKKWIQGHIPKKIRVSYSAFATVYVFAHFPVMLWLAITQDASLKVGVWGYSAYSESPITGNQSFIVAGEIRPKYMAAFMCLFSGLWLFFQNISPYFGNKRYIFRATNSALGEMLKRRYNPFRWMEFGIQSAFFFTIIVGVLCGVRDISSLTLRSLIMLCAAYGLSEAERTYQWQLFRAAFLCTIPAFAQDSALVVARAPQVPYVANTFITFYVLFYCLFFASALELYVAKATKDPPSYRYTEFLHLFLSFSTKTFLGYYVCFTLLPLV